MEWYALENAVVQLKSENWMPQTPHIEKHFTGSEVIRDIVIGMSDGLTVPFALAAGTLRDCQLDRHRHHRRAG